MGIFLMKLIKDIKYCDNCHEKQTLDLYLPENNNFSVFIYFHGGGLNSGDKKDNHIFIDDLIKNGIAVVCANYRLYPSAVFPQFIQDAAMTVSWTKEHISEYGNCKKIFVGGSSAGGYITQMLCFDKKYLAINNIDADGIDGYFMDAGQPTSHFNVLRERGYDSRRVIVDKTAPLYYIEDGRKLPPIKILVSDHDMPNRLEQNLLLVSTLRCFGYEMNKVDLEIVENSGHCDYLSLRDENGNSVFGEKILNFIKKWE